MTREQRKNLLLAAIAAQQNIAVNFASRCGIRDPDFVLEVIQETTLRILSRAADTFDPDQGSPGPFVGRILYNVCISQMLLFYRNQKIPPDFDELTDDWNPVEIACRREGLRDIHTAIDRLGIAERNRLMKWGGPRKKGKKKNKAPKKSTPHVNVYRAKHKLLGAIIDVRRSRLRYS